MAIEPKQLRGEHAQFAGSAYANDRTPCLINPNYSQDYFGHLVIDFVDKDAFAAHTRAYNVRNLTGVGLPTQLSATMPDVPPVSLLTLLGLGEEIDASGNYSATLAPIPGRVDWKEVKAVSHLLKTRFKQALGNLQESNVVPYGLEKLSVLHWSESQRKFYSLMAHHWVVDSSLFGFERNGKKAQEFYGRAHRVDERSFEVAIQKAKDGQSLETITLF